MQSAQLCHPLVVILLLLFLYASGSLCPKRIINPLATPTNTVNGKLTYSDADAFISSGVLLWFISLPSLLQIGSGALKCWHVGGGSFVFIDLQKTCWKDDHLYYSMFVSFPMIFLYGFILPGFFMLRLRRAGSARLTDPSLMLRWGMLHSGYREEKYWWELMVLCRKYLVILLVTFNTRGEFQLHLALGVLIVALHMHDAQHPFGHRHVRKHHKNILYTVAICFLSFSHFISLLFFFTGGPNKQYFASL